MNSSPLFRRTPLLAGALCTATTLCFAQLDASSAARLDALRAAPQTVGDLVYKGAVHSLEKPSNNPLFTYERRVVRAANGITAAHITSNPGAAVIILETTQTSLTYDLQRFEVLNQQAGFSGSVVVSDNGHRLDYQLTDKGKTTTATQTIDTPAVSGPQLFGYVRQHWATLRAGTCMPVRMIVLKSKTTYGFDICFEREAKGQTAFSIAPSSLFVRLAIAPMRLVFESNANTVIRYEGRVPPLQTDQGKAKDLDARVDYTAAIPVYR